MSGVLATTTVASCSTPSRTLCAASSGGLRPSLTAPAHNALASSDRNEETPRFNQTKKHHRQKPKPLLHSLTDTTLAALRKTKKSRDGRIRAPCSGGKKKLLPALLHLGSARAPEAMSSYKSPSLWAAITRELSPADRYHTEYWSNLGTGWATSPRRPCPLPGDVDLAAGRHPAR